MKIRITIVGLALISFPRRGFAQPMRIVPSELGTRRAQMEKATENWRAIDRGLEAGLLRRNPRDVLAQIELAEAKVRVLGDVHKAYYEALIRPLQEQLQELEASPNPFSAPFELLHQDAEDRQAELVALEDRLKQELRKYEGGPSDQDVAMGELLRSQLRNVELMQKELQKQAQLSATGQKLALNPARRQAIERTRDLLHTLELEASKAEQETDLWSEYYQSLRDLVMRSRVQPESKALDSKKPAKPACSKVDDK
jgi:hypothetical protein